MSWITAQGALTPAIATSRPVPVEHVIVIVLPDGRDSMQSLKHFVSYPVYHAPSSTKFERNLLAMTSPELCVV